MNTKDKRVIKTKNLIKNTVVDLAYNRNIDEISITDICKKAAIQRATFYNHYANVVDVFIDIENDILSIIQDNFVPIDFSNIRQSVRAFFIKTARSFTVMDDRYKKILSSKNPVVLNHIKDWFINSAVVLIEQMQHKLSEQDKFMINMCIHGLLETFLSWYTGGSRLTFNEILSYGVDVVEIACQYINLN